MNKKIAVTGATGFVGGHLIDFLLSNNYDVRALTRRPQENRENLTWIEGDLDNKSALSELIENCDAIINVAGAVKAKNKNEFMNTNAQSVSTIVEILKQQCFKNHLIQISSLAAREPDLSDYAFSKNAGEENIINADVGFNWTIVRPPGIYGPNDFETLKIFKLLKWHLALYPSDKNNRASWIHVSDLVKYITHMINNPVYYKNILELDDGKENGYSHEEFVSEIANHMKIKPIAITIPKIVLKIFGLINDIVGRIFGFAPMVSSKKANEICHTDWTVKNGCAASLREYHEARSLNEGLKETLDWYKNNKYI